MLPCTNKGIRFTYEGYADIVQSMECAELPECEELPGRQIA